MIRAALVASTALFVSPAFAQQTAAPPAPPAPPRDHVHERVEDEIIVTASFVRDLDLLAGTATLTGEELARDVRPQIGDTLTRLPGVSATSFSPGASRPVLRGFQGERVRVLTDGLGSIDVSNTSADHAVTIDPITAERVEVLHGPAVLLFGSQAIGGAVNVFDRRIPRVVPDDPIHIDALATYGSAAGEASIGVGVDIPVGRNFVVHFDGSYRDTDDLDVGGFVLSPGLRAEQLEIAAEEEEEGHAEEAAEARRLAGLRGTLPNSATRTKTAGFGVAYIGSRGNLGASISLYDTRYGVPLRPGAGHHHGEEGEEEAEGGEEEAVPVAIDLRQVRGDLRGEYELGGALFERVRVRAAIADYEHIEFEGDEVGTLFETDGVEGRVELVQANRGGWRGVVGAQYFLRDFNSVGAEAFLPANETSQLGLFTLQEVAFGPGQIEGALRYERSEIESDPLGIARGFDAFSAAIGASYELAPRVRIGLNLSRAERAPAAEELFSNGPHVATQAFEIGDPTFDTERSIGGELFLRAQLPGVRFNGTLFYNRFDNYIFANDTGDEEDGLPVFQYFQTDAEYWGFEAGFEADVARIGDVRIGIDGVADYVEATIGDGGGPVPRIPPLRLLGGVEARGDRFAGRVEVEHVFEQDRVAAFETPTDPFTLVNASVSFRPFGRDNPTSLILSANNILDVDARRHASFTKEFVPLAGRDVRATLRVSF